MRITARRLLLGVAVIAASCGVAWAQIGLGGDRGSAGPRPLLQVLRHLAVDAPVDLRVDPAVADLVVDVDTEALPFELAIKQVLLASGADFVMAWRNGRLQVRAGDLRDAVEIAAVAPTDPAGRAGRSVRSEAKPTATANESEPVELPDPDGVDPQATADEGGVEAPGAVTGQELAALLAVPRGFGPPSPPNVITLPFTDASGQPVRMVRPTTPRTAVELPFTDATGQPVMQPLAPRSPGVIELPFPDANGQPIRLVVPAGAVSPRRPGER